MKSNKNGVYKPSDSILVKPENVNKNELTSYENVDSGDSFRFDLGNRDRINILFFQFMTKMETPYKIWQIISCIFKFFIRKTKCNKILLNKVIEYNRDNYIILGYIFDIINKIYSYFFI